MNNKPGIITRAQQKQHTRRKLIEATMAVIAAEGFSGVTMAKVAEKAGLSRGIGNFHFQSKEQLLLETLHTLYMEFENGWRNAVADAGLSPVDQLKELIKTTLQPPIADFKKVAVWLAYWGEAPSRKKYLEICAAHDREWDRAVENILRLLVDDAFNSHGMTLAKIAHSLTAMMDGFWVEYLIADGRYTPDDAVKACFAFLASFFPEFRKHQ
ncbi:MAG: TetR family transcriptional regulator C-terminal domain-containing protein [Desulfobacteraceae bacterium]|nr:TetR family transcriptional regulator C-terminal domain-containing protein [Desulfobacteraceae bacterium]